MVRQIVLTCLLMVTVCLIGYSQTYTITEEELVTLENVIRTQQTQLAELKQSLTEALTELKKAEEALQQQKISLNEYEQGALRIQQILQDDIALKVKQLRDWQIALPITGLSLFVGGVILGHFAK